MRIARGSAASTSTPGTRSLRRPVERYGPAVCGGVSPGGSVRERLDAGRLPSSEEHVPAIAVRPVRPGELDVEGADKPVPRALVAHGVEYRIEREERVIREVLLR